MKKERLDRLVVARGLVDSREKAQRMILAGKVLIDGHVYGKSGMRIDS
ncbi:MAG: S4 domain-containing protein, partial [Verrucomicrobiota bacterium]